MAGKSKARRLTATALIAPCGMNCGLCHAFLRSRNRCPGCRTNERGEMRVACKIRNCETRRGKRFCTSCTKFPCERVCHIDKRYRTKYGMSMIENLKSIKAVGLRSFVDSEKIKWACPGCGAPLCVHKAGCLVCRGSPAYGRNLNFVSNGEP